MSFHLRGYYPLWLRFPSIIRLTHLVLIAVHNTTSSQAFTWLFGLTMDPFHSPLLRISLLLSLPPPTGMLSFGGFPCITAFPHFFCMGKILIRASRDRRLLAPTPRLSQLATPFIGLTAKVSVMYCSAESIYLILGSTRYCF